MSKAVNTLALVLGVSLPLATAQVAHAQSSSAVSDFWSSVAKSAGSDVGGVVAGYALSALGLSGPSQEDADLKAIESLLTDIDNELAELINEVQALECLTAQDQSTLTSSIKNIQGLYDTYAEWVQDSPTVPCWEQSDTSGDVCFGQTGIKTWLNEVIDPANGVDAALDAIADVMIQAGNTGVIYECVVTITNNYKSSKTDGPAQHVFDDVYYTQVQELTNYYYGVQAQGAALLSEANHLQACLSLGLSDCQFTGQTSTNARTPGSASATPSDPGAICDDAAPGSQAAADCMNAQTAVAKVYDNVKAQLIQAGAPYTTDLVGKVWNDDAVFAKSLEDFTNNATANGKKIQATPCATPLTSAAPCGFTVGAYNLEMPNDQKIDYGGYSFWSRTGGGDLKDLLDTYNNETSGSTSGTLGQWMNSVGFKTAQNKIVLTPSTGKNWGTTTVCFMDTSVARSAAKQPWCDGSAQSTSNLAKQGNHGGCGGACYFADYSQASFTGSSVDSGFYTMSVTYWDDYGITYDWSTKPGWLTEEQGNAKFHQFHWPAFAISALGSDWCTVREKGTTPQSNVNPGGILSTCGSDLQTWLDQVLPNPDVSFRVQTAREDGTLLGVERNRNDGANGRLTLMGPRGVGSHVIALKFDEALVQSFLDDGPLGQATLVLTIAENHGGWGAGGQLVTAYGLRDAFEEGNGNAAADDRGTGRGATWNCAVDAEISNDVKECAVDWSGSRFVRRGAVSTPHDDGLVGQVAWDVTEHVADGITAWTIWKESRSRGGSVDYHSREGARAQFDTGLAPALVLER